MCIGGHLVETIHLLLVTLILSQIGTVGKIAFVFPPPSGPGL